MSIEQKIEHNKKIIRDAVSTLITNHMVDPFRMVANREYSMEKIREYLNAVNVARDMMNMPKVYLYGYNDMEDE